MFFYQFRNSLLRISVNKASVKKPLKIDHEKNVMLVKINQKLCYPHCRWSPNCRRDYLKQRNMHEKKDSFATFACAESKRVSNNNLLI